MMRKQFAKIDEKFRSKYFPSSYWANPTGGDGNPYEKTWAENIEEIYLRGK